VRETIFHRVILASALFTWGCVSTGTPLNNGVGGSSGTAGKGSGGTSTGSGGYIGGGTGGSGTGGSNGGGTGGKIGGTGGTSGGGTGGAGNGVGGAASGTGGGAGGASSTGATVQLGQTHQTIQGFGINDNWNAQFSSTIADALFSTTGTGIGLTILRTGMSDQGAFYNSGEAAGNIAAVKSRAGTNAKIIGSVWSPPANCKTNTSVNDGGHLMTSCYDSWSTTIANFAGSNGFYAMSIANEPDFASCGSADPCNGNYPTTLFTAAEFVAWVKMAGPKLQAKNVKVIAPEASEWLHNWSNVSAGPDLSGKESSDPLKCGCFPDKNTNSCAATCTAGMGYDYGHWLAKDTAAWAAFDIMGVHEYDSQVAYPWPSDVNGGKVNKEVWQTEMSGVKWWPEQGTTSGTLMGTGDIGNGVAVAGWIHSALVDGEASAWLWWWYNPLSGGTNDNEGLILQNGNDTKRHWTLGNYSKFVRPGYTRVDVTGAPSGVLLSAYKGSDGTVVIVAINKNASAVNVPITIAGGTAPAMMTPNVTSSASTDNLAAKTAVAVSGGSFTAALLATSVTTFVGK